jgi:hypothetical protein
MGYDQVIIHDGPLKALRFSRRVGRESHAFGIDILIPAKQTQDGFGGYSSSVILVCTFKDWRQCLIMTGELGSVGFIAVDP